MLLLNTIVIFVMLIKTYIKLFRNSSLNKFCGTLIQIFSKDCPRLTYSSNFYQQQYSISAGIVF